MSCLQAYSDKRQPRHHPPRRPTHVPQAACDRGAPGENEREVRDRQNPKVREHRHGKPERLHVGGGCLRVDVSRVRVDEGVGVVAEPIDERRVDEKREEYLRSPENEEFLPSRAAVMVKKVSQKTADSVSPLLDAFEERGLFHIGSVAVVKVIRRFIKKTKRVKAFDKFGKQHFLSESNRATVRAAASMLSLYKDAFSIFAACRAEFAKLSNLPGLVSEIIRRAGRR